MDSSESDDDIDAPEFLKIFSKRSAVTAFSSETLKTLHLCEAIWSSKFEASPQKVNRLDSLLSEHVKEAAERTRLEKVKEGLLQDLHDDSQDDLLVHSQSLASEHEDQLQQFDVKSSEPHIHPGIKLFDPERFCCLYFEQTNPFACGFTQSGSSIDKILASTVPETLTTLLLSKAIVTCVHQIKDVNSVLIWLLNVWAKADDLLGKHHNYSQDEIRKFLTVENNENLEHQDNVTKQLRTENVQMIYKVFALALQTSPSITKEDLNQMFFMFAKVELDDQVNKSVCLEAQECFTAVLQSYNEEDWQSVVPHLCRRLYEVTEHHHNQVHLADLLPGTSRGRFLQARLSYFCLRLLLSPQQDPPGDDEIKDLKLCHIPNLCLSTERPALSPLAQALRTLLEEDFYKMISAIKLLDMCVGDDLYRADQPWKSLEYLIKQTNLVIRIIKDNISAMDLSKIKDSLSKLKVKWSLSLQDHHSKQRSIFPWLSQSSRTTITQEVLKDQHALLDDDLE